MTEGSKAAFHALAVVISVFVLMIAIGVAIGGAVQLDYRYLTGGIIGTIAAALFLWDTIRNRPGI